MTYLIGLKVLVVLSTLMVSVYIIVAVLHIVLRVWAAYRNYKVALGEKGAYSLRIVGKFAAAFVVAMVQLVATLIWDMYREDQFPLILRITTTFFVLFFATKAVIPINMIIEGVMHVALGLTNRVEPAPARREQSIDSPSVRKE